MILMARTEKGFFSDGSDLNNTKPQWKQRFASCSLNLMFHPLYFKRLSP